MATGGGGKGWKQQGDGGGSGSWLLTGLKIGAAIGAAALGAYTAVKMTQQEEKESPMRSGCGSDSSEDEGRGGSPSTSSNSGASSRRLPEPQRKPSGSLVDELNEYYDSHIGTSSATTMTILDLVEKTRQRLSSYLMRNHRRFIKGELTPAALERLTCGQRTEFKLMLQLAFNPQMWEFIDATDTILSMPGFFCVRRVNLDFFGIGRSPWDRFLIGSYLCPDLLTEFWKKVMERMLSDEMVLDFYTTVRRHAGGMELNIENPVGGFGDMICIKIIPFMRFEKNGKPITITTQSVANVQIPGKSYSEGMSSNPHENLWLQSLEEEALHKMDTLDADGGCRRKCVAILDVLRASHPPLKMLSCYVMATILLKVCEVETEWDEEMLAERFLDLLKALEGYLRAASLRDHFNDGVDVLAGCCSPALIAESQKWLAHVLESKDRIADLLYD